MVEEHDAEYNHKEEAPRSRRVESIVFVCFLTLSIVFALFDLLYLSESLLRNR